VNTTIPHVSTIHFVLGPVLGSYWMVGWHISWVHRLNVKRMFHLLLILFDHSFSHTPACVLVLKKPWVTLQKQICIPQHPALSHVSGFALEWRDPHQLFASNRGSSSWWFTMTAKSVNSFQLDHYSAWTNISKILQEFRRSCWMTEPGNQGPLGPNDDNKRFWFHLIN